MVIKSNDGGTWRRVRVIPFLSRFEYNPVDNDPLVPYQFKRDDNLDEKLEKWKEIFMAMLVKRACETNGKVEDCEIVLQESNKYRIKEDHISRFVSEKIVKDPKGKIKKTELNNEFNLWYQICEGNKGGPSPKELHAYMNKYFGNVKNNVWVGVSILYDHKNENTNIDDSEEDDVSSEDL
jgi:phage/plasmid-associated DNA primase